MYPNEIKNDLQSLISDLNSHPTDENLWNGIIALQGRQIYTASGLPFSYSIKIGKNGAYTKELIIDRRTESKTLSFGSIRLAFHNALNLRGQLIRRPKSLGDIRGISYIYPILFILEVIDIPEGLCMPQDTN